MLGEVEHGPPQMTVGDGMLPGSALGDSSGLQAAR